MIAALTAETAVNVKMAVALFKSGFDGKHRVGVVVFNGKLHHIRMLRRNAQGVKVAEDEVGDNVVLASVFIACVGGYDIVAVVGYLTQSEKIACTDYIALMSVHP